MSSALATRIAAEHAAASVLLPAEVVSPERRRDAIETLAAEGLPTSRDENWKYTNLRPLEKVRFTPPAVIVPVGPGPGSQPSLKVADLPAGIEGYSRYTFVDGVYAPALSTPVSRAGVTVTSARSSLTSQASTPTLYSARLGDAQRQKDTRFALLNDAFATDVAAIRVTAGTDCPTCIELVFVATVESHAGASYPRVELQVEQGARLGLIERHVSVGAGANFVNASVRVDLARDATVNHYRVQESGAKAIWFDTLSAVLAQGATYKLHGVNAGGLSSRSTINVLLAGERADASISVASLGDRQQIQDAFVRIEHSAPHARSEQTFRGISAGRARVAFNGMVVVREGAHGTDSQQSLRGLLAGPEAEIDLRPQLQIDTDDVRCAHGATAGKLDDDMLFYLLSRGIDPETAQRLLKWAFLEDVVARIEVPELRRQIERSLAEQMQESAALKELL
ncbi:MAG TPA: Fe-S cluster assembly protein SufD [Steroidobacteraceae bacterium]